ncbi:MAG: hypothetical protein LC798_19305 [Chloroflexi bacterium]|nr:hypothetical protein [Chloroflexota bacterium]
MPEIYDSQLKARLSVDDADRVRGINHVDEYWESTESSPKETAVAYLRQVADTFAVQDDQLAYAHQQVEYLRPEGDRGTEFRSSEEKELFDATTEGFYQTHRNVPVWAAGVSVTVKHGPLRVVSAVNTSLDGLDAELPSEEVIDRWRKLFLQAAAEQPAQGFDFDVGPSTARSDTARFVGELVAGRAFRRSSRRATSAEREETRGAQIISGRFFIYRYDPDERLPRDEKPAQPDPVIGFAGAEEQGFQAPERTPTLPLPAVDRRIRPGADYLVAEIIFRYVTAEWGDINWRVLVELETGSILYLRPMAASVNGLVFLHDPISESGNAANGPTATNAILNPFRDDVVLPNLNAPSGGIQSLVGWRVRLNEQEAPTVASPTQPSGTDFDYEVRTNNFAGVNAYYHTERFFSLVAGMGFPNTYWGGTVFPVPVDHRGLGTAVNAHCVGNATGITHLCYALADATDTANPISIATDWKVHLHEMGGHGILYPHVGGPNFGFSHSAGDSMAVILVDPESIAPDRFVLAPFVPLVGRRHDRPVATWGWDGPNAVGGYSSEQVLSTTLFRAYRSIGGDAADIGRRRFAARYMAYLILRTVNDLTPATNPAHARAFANSMIAVDALNWTSEGLYGGAYGKVIRWAFEQQGLRFDPPFPSAGTVTTVGPPPPVDVYIDDGRAGEYQYQPVHWNTTAIWNRKKADGGLTHQTPKLNKKNYAYVKIKNRGTQTANNVVVRGFHTKPAAGLLWPADFEPFNTAQLSAGTLNPNSTEEKIVGPFEWEPNVNAYGHDCMLMIVSATSDPSNIDNFTPGEVIPEWRLVPNDNNIGQRNVNLLPGGGGGKSLMEGLHGFHLWVGNPNPGRAVIDIDVKLPAVLAERGWKLGFEGLRNTRFSLPSRQQRELVIELEPGAPFDRADIESADDRDIVLAVNADGGRIGGMTYRVDPAIEHAEDRPGATPGGADTDKCLEHAAELLECLDLHGHGVTKVRVKKITLEVGMDGECC